jgi:hypothetical protein
MKNGIGLKIGMAGIVLVPLHLCIFNNHNPSQVFAQAKANATSIHHPFAIVIGDCDIGSLVFVAPTAVCTAISVTWRTPAIWQNSHRVQTL